MDGCLLESSHMTADVAAHSADLPKPLQQESMHECPKCTATKASALQHGTQHDPENDGDVDHSRVVRTNKCHLIWSHAFDVPQP